VKQAADECYIVYSAKRQYIMLPFMLQKGAVQDIFLGKYIFALPLQKIFECITRINN
jgi:hypothetical protein